MPFSRDRTLVSCIAGRFFNQLNHQRSKEMEGSRKEGSGLRRAASHCKHPGSRELQVPRGEGWGAELWVSLNYF